MIPLILAVDTTGAHGSLALASGDRLLQEVTLHAPDGYSEILFGAIEELLAANALLINDVVLFAAASGPGTFTGVRVGLACVKGLAEAMSRPVCAVSNLEAVASFGSRPRRAAMLDARRNEIYAGVYDAAGHPLQGECLTSREVFVLEPDIEIVNYDGPLGAAIARIAFRRLQAGEVNDPAEIEANYIRRSDAELHLSVRLQSSLPRK